MTCLTTGWFKRLKVITLSAGLDRGLFPLVFDLHSHSIFSDGALPPAELIARALEMQVNTLAITDHDTVAGLKALTLDNPTCASSINLVAGIELSTQWQSTGIHVLGLNIDPDSASITEAAHIQMDARQRRAEQISINLEKQGIKEALEGARQHANGQFIGRPHFARWLVEQGIVKNMQAAFKQYLGQGKAGDVKQHWADLPQVIEWIRDANGIAVLAHPLKYKLTRTRLKRFLGDFINAGGQGIEVISGQQQPQDTAGMADLCMDKNLLASCGSDFHAPGKSWSELGRFAAMPGKLTPVWDRF